MGVGRLKEFFGLVPPAGEDEAYYDDEPRYNTDSLARDYSSRQLTPTIVPLTLTSYTQAKEIGDPFRDGDVVVFSMESMDMSEARRIVDFAAGLCFGLRGTMKKVDQLTFALIPENVKISTLQLERAARI